MGHLHGGSSLKSSADEPSALGSTDVFRVGKWGWRLDSAR